VRLSVAANVSDSTGCPLLPPPPPCVVARARARAESLVLLVTLLLLLWLVLLVLLVKVLLLLLPLLGAEDGTALLAAPEDRLPSPATMVTVTGYGSCGSNMQGFSQSEIVVCAFALV